MTTSTTRKARSARARASGQHSLTPWLIGAALFFVVLIGLVVVLNSRSTRIPVKTLDLPDEWIDGTAIGDPTAPVTVEAWEDFLCPHCRNWTAQIEPQLVEEFVKTGKIRFVFRHLPLQGFAPGSFMGAQASLCAADQDAFWPYHDALFGTAHNRGQAGFTFEALTDLADEVGLDERDFVQCMSSQRHSSTVNESLQQASQLQLTATPSVLINGTRIADPFDFAAIRTQIDALVASEG
jgi:protein-disulfide isomerase